MLQHRKMIQISTENLNWYESTYGGATLSWIVDMCLTEFRLAHTITPQQYAEIAGQQLYDKVQEEVE